RLALASILRVLSFIDTSLLSIAFGEGAYRVSRFPCSELPHMLLVFDSAVANHSLPLWYD
ncbi:MAG: hypothetical protein WCG61_02965, partial [Chlorobium sp.]